MALQEQSELVLQFKRKQIVIAVFLILFILTITGFLLYFAYGLMGGKSSAINNMAGKKPLLMPISNVSLANTEKKQGGDYILYGEFSNQDKKYKIFKVYYKGLVKEEIFSFNWNDLVSQPTLAVYKKRIAIFSSINGGFFINYSGRVASTDEFIPPSRYFSVSPDGKKMFYFKYLSSLGNTMLVLRDLEKNQDVHTWPLNSPASEICDFSGWSPDGIKAYCLLKKSALAKVEALDSKNYSYASIASADNATDVKYYPNLSLFVVASENGISVYNTGTNEKKQIISAPKSVAIKNVFLVPDGSRVLYTAVSADGAVYGIYSANIDGSDQKELKSVGNADLISISPDSQNMLYKIFDQNDRKIERNFTSDINGENAAELYVADSDIFSPQFVGWFPSDTK